MESASSEDEDGVQETPRRSTAIHGSNVASTFSQANDFKIGDQNKFTNINHQENHYSYSDSGCQNGLKILEQFVAHGAFYDSAVRDPQIRCHPGTRESVMTKIRDWVNDTGSAPRMMWLYGAAGVGKSSIARTIAEHLHSEGQLAATFFFSRTIPDCNNANRLFTTLAWQLATSIPQLKPHIDKAMVDDPLLHTRIIETQFDRLIAAPFKEIGKSGATLPTPKRVVVIDGVDECDGEDNRTGEQMQIRFLKLLEDAAVNDATSLRFLICSRPELHLRKALNIDNSASRASHDGSPRQTVWQVLRRLRDWIRTSLSEFIKPWVVMPFKPPLPRLSNYG